MNNLEKYRLALKTEKRLKAQLISLNNALNALKGTPSDAIIEDIINTLEKHINTLELNIIANRKLISKKGQ